MHSRTGTLDSEHEFCSTSRCTMQSCYGHQGPRLMEESTRMLSFNAQRDMAHHITIYDAIITSVLHD